MPGRKTKTSSLLPLPVFFRQRSIFPSIIGTGSRGRKIWIVSCPFSSDSFYVKVMPIIVLSHVRIVCHVFHPGLKINTTAFKFILKSKNIPLLHSSLSTTGVNHFSGVFYFRFARYISFLKKQSTNCHFSTIFVV